MPNQQTTIVVKKPTPGTDEEAKLRVTVQVGVESVTPGFRTCTYTVHADPGQGILQGRPCQISFRERGNALEDACDKVREVLRV